MTEHTEYCHAMTHKSKKTGKTYQIAEAVTPVDATGNRYNFDITLYFLFTGDDEPVQLCGWHFGAYDYNIAEQYITQ